MLPTRFGELKNKEIICSSDGLRVGYVDDLVFDPETYRITHLIAYGKWRFFGLFGRYRDARIPCEQIRVIGEDIILVDQYEPEERKRPGKEHFFDRFFE